MRSLAGPDALIHFTHLSPSSSNSLSTVFRDNNDSSLAMATAHEIGVLELMKNASVALDRVCLLDPKAEHGLSPEDGDGKFEWFLFGVLHYTYYSVIFES